MNHLAGRVSIREEKISPPSHWMRNEIKLLWEWGAKRALWMDVLIVKYVRLIIDDFPIIHPSMVLSLSLYLDYPLEAIIDRGREREKERKFPMKLLYVDGNQYFTFTRWLLFMSRILMIFAAVDMCVINFDQPFNSLSLSLCSMQVCIWRHRNKIALLFLDFLKLFIFIRCEIK